MVKTVIFDIDNTLYDYNQADAVAFGVLTDYVTERIGLPADTFAILHQKAMRDMEASMGDVAAVHNRLLRYQHILEEEGLPLYPHALEMEGRYWDSFLEALAPSPGAEEAMGQLKEQAVKIGIGTNMTASIQFKKLDRLGLLPFVDFIVSSEEAGVEKPDPAFFRQCIEKAGCGYAECLFVGDSLKKDAQGAAAVGMQAVWYRPGGFVPEEAVAQITDLRSLPQMALEL